MATRLLISYNQKLIREGLKQILKNLTDFEIIAEAGSFDSVLEKDKNNPCDIIILDLDMFGKRGIETIISAKKNSPTTAILCISNHVEDRYALRYLKAGACGYISKATVYEDLANALRRIVATGRYLSNTLAEVVAFDVVGNTNNKAHERLSKREMETFSLLVKEKNIKEISEELKLSTSTIFTYRIRIFEKLKVKTNNELIQYAIDNELTEFNNKV